jgi:hypothetical protein
MPSKKLVSSDVRVSRLDVSEHRSHLKESAERNRLWLPFSQAAEFIDDLGLARFFATLSLVRLAQDDENPGP